MKLSRDWGNELLESAKWLLLASGITAVLFVVVGVALVVTTKWGRQFWRLNGAYFTGRGAWRPLGYVVALLILAVWGVRMTALFTYQSNDMYTAMQYAGQAVVSGKTGALHSYEHVFWYSVQVFCILATVHVIRTMIEYFIGQAFEIEWRVWLTDRITADWLDGRAHYRNRFIDSTIDNPDQRVQEDITTVVQQSHSLIFQAVSNLVSVVVFTAILWDLSGPMTIAGTHIPRAMVFIVIIFVLLASVVAFWVGRPLIRYNFRYQAAMATFRYALVRVRENAESIAFYRGEQVEHRGLARRFADAIVAQWRIVYQETGFQAWNLVISQISVVFPILLQMPRFFTGAITIGDIQQSASAFGNVHDSLSFFRNNYDVFTQYRAALLRLDGMETADIQSRELPRIAEADLDGSLELENIDVRLPDGAPLIEALNLHLVPGDALVVKGASGSGKTTLLRTLAEMWPYGSGTIRRPGANGTLFLSQLPYLPLGDLRTAVSYPAESGDIPDEPLRDALTKVSLGHLADRLDEAADWAKILSPGEQQRLAFARILLMRPQLVFLDEATSAMDEGLEHAVYTLIRTEAPDTMLVSVAHRSTVDQFHTQRLELGGEGGAWNLEPMPAAV
ncbi:ABC transporter ATP-binding protein/permease [Nocardia alni]|uniref:ABC transporter ATP-binding protein/permease n=1 Tax=Nocardia alni TaxID=2815723 RepID=UPI001C236D41|nr:ABC transporter ATP-binding protein/permease [Nocardia alni]